MIYLLTNNNMNFLVNTDDTKLNSLEDVLYDNEWAKFSDIIFDGNGSMVVVEKDNGKDVLWECKPVQASFDVPKGELLYLGE